VLFVSHSAESVMQLCNKGLLLKEGRVVACGSVKDITSQYLDSLHLSHVDPKLIGIADSRTGLLSGAATSLLIKELTEGFIAHNCPVETPDGIIVADIGWVSPSRRKTLRMEPTWGGAPDLCVLIASASKPYELIEKEHSRLLSMGAREIWLVRPDGSVVRCLPEGYSFLIKNKINKINFLI